MMWTGRKTDKDGDERRIRAGRGGVDRICVKVKVFLQAN
jgi:hypothetical protein